MTGESSCSVGKKYCHNNSLKEEEYGENMRCANQPLTISPWTIGDLCGFATFDTDLPSNICSVFILFRCDLSWNILFIIKFTFRTFEDLKYSIVRGFGCRNRWRAKKQNPPLENDRLNEILTVLSVLLDTLEWDKDVFEDFDRLNCRSMSSNQSPVHVSMEID